MERCTKCGSEIDNGSNAYKLNQAVRWWDFNSEQPGYVQDVSGFGRVELVEIMDRVREEQGLDDQLVYIVVKVNGKYYKKHGTEDSYGDLDWDGHVREVFPTEKTVTVYEF